MKCMHKIKALEVCSWAFGSRRSAQESLVAGAAPLVPVVLHIHKSALHCSGSVVLQSKNSHCWEPAPSQEPRWKMIPVQGAAEITEFLPGMSSKLNNNQCLWINALSQSLGSDGWASAKCCSPSSAHPLVWQQTGPWVRGWTVPGNENLSSVKALLKRSRASALEKLLQF